MYLIIYLDELCVQRYMRVQARSEAEARRQCPDAIIAVEKEG